jgi:hypothetical protein
LLSISTPLPAGVSEPAATAVTEQPTELAAGADAPVTAGVTSVNAVGSPEPSAVAGEVADASSVEVSLANKAVEPSGAAVQAGADKSLVTSIVATDVPPTSEFTSAQSSAETGTGAGAVVDPSCVDDRPAEVQKLLKLETPHDHKWTMTGKKCEPRANADTAPRFVAYWSQ